LDTLISTLGIKALAGFVMHSHHYTNKCHSAAITAPPATTTTLISSVRDIMLLGDDSLLISERE
jgi:hypothetical protein